MTTVTLALAMAFASTATQPAAFEQLSRDAAAARDGNRADDAIRLYRQALANRPTWDQGLWFLGTLLYEKERFAEAEETLRRFVAVDADAGPGWVLLGMSEFQTREYERSLDHLQRGLAIGLGERVAMARSAWYFVAVLLTRAERFDESMDLLFDVRRSGPPSNQPADSIIDAAGLAALRLPLTPGEIAPDRRAVIKLAGKAAWTLYGAHQQEEAEGLLKQLVTEYPTEPGVHFLYGAILMDSRPEEAMAEIRRELEISPNHIAARVRLVDRYLRENNAETALPLARQAVALSPDISAAHLALGEVLAHEKDYVGAIVELETARRQSPAVVRIRWALSRAYSAAGRPEDAAREADEVKKLRQSEEK
ncbi:MAG: tetratricopeptide repeat protein [Bryobacteraceae bacterium]